jgi:hypothetical protein
MVEVAKAAT